MNKPRVHTNPLYLSSIIGLLCGAITGFLPLGNTQAEARTILDRTEAAVNSALILHSQIGTFRQTVRLRSQLDPLFATTLLAQPGRTPSDKEIVEYLIDETLIVQKFPVTTQEVDQDIAMIVKNNHITEEDLYAAIKREGFDRQAYRDEIRISASKRRLIDEIRMKIAISDTDVENELNRSSTEDKALPRAFHVRMITVSVPNYKDQGAALDHIREAKKLLDAGKPFDDIAKEYSDDHAEPTSLEEEQLAPAIRDEVEKLNVGQVSNILGSAKSGSFFLIKLEGFGVDTKHKAEKMDAIRNKLAAGEYQHQIALWLERTRQTAFIHHHGMSLVNEIPKGI